MKISKDTPAYYFTAVTKDRLPVFRTTALAQVTCNALNEARISGGFLIFAYVLMPDHIHFITDSVLSKSEVLRFANGITGKRVIDYLKENNHHASLSKLRHLSQRRKYVHSLWDHRNNDFSIYSEEILMQKVNYIHQNPVRAGLVDVADKYQWSSVRCWKGRPINEPLEVNMSNIQWREGVALRR